MQSTSSPRQTRPHPIRLTQQPTYAEVLSTSASSTTESGESIGVTRRHQIRSEQHELDDTLRDLFEEDNNNNAAVGDEVDHLDDFDELDDEMFQLEESLRRGDAAQARRRRMAPRRSPEATPDELSSYTATARSGQASAPPNAPLVTNSSLPTIIHPADDIPFFTRSESPDEIDMLRPEVFTIGRRSASVISGTSARRSNSIYSPARGSGGVYTVSGNAGGNDRMSEREPGGINASGSARPRPVSPIRELPSLSGIISRERASRDIASSINFGSVEHEEDELAWVPSRPPRGLAASGADIGKIVYLLYCGGSSTQGKPELPSHFYYLDQPDHQPVSAGSSSYALRQRIAKMQDEERVKDKSGGGQTGGCGALICARAATTLDSRYLESDCPPSAEAADWLDIKDHKESSHNMGGWRLWQNCGCTRANIGCISCGNTIGAATIRPCTRCARRYLGHPRYTFYAESVTKQPRSVRMPAETLAPRRIAGDNRKDSDSEMWWKLEPSKNSSPSGRRMVPSRDEDIRSGLAGDPVLWAESSRDLLRKTIPVDDNGVKRVWTDWLDEPDRRRPSTSNPAVGSRPTDRPWRHRTDWSIGSAGSSASIFFGDSGLTTRPLGPPGRIDPSSTIPLLAQAEEELEEAERTFMASAAPSIAAEHAAITGNSEEQTVEQIRSSAPAIAQRARALRRNLQDFVNRIPGQPAEPTVSMSASSGQRRRRSMSQGEFDEMTERILRDARRRRLESDSTSRPATRYVPDAGLVGR